MILLESQEVNSEAVRHCFLLRVVLKLASSVKEHLTQQPQLKILLLNFYLYIF